MWHLGYMGRRNPWAMLTKCGVLRGVGVARGVTLPSPIDLRCRPYNTGDRVIVYYTYALQRRLLIS